jgi:hypothetical protein
MRRNEVIPRGGILQQKRAAKMKVVKSGTLAAAGSGKLTLAVLLRGQAAVVMGGGGNLTHNNA